MLRGLNELFERPLTGETLTELAGSLGSDVPFFLQNGAAMATGRGEIIQPLGKINSMEGNWLLIFHFGFGVPTGWAYQQLAKFDDCIHGRKGKGEEFATALNTGDESAWKQLYNSFEKPVFSKFPILGILKEFLISNGASGVLMSGSGSAVFAVVKDVASAKALEEKTKSYFGSGLWSCCVPA
jgi:4-diphosphocytidyl-2-C-methyl-D-erythritol kinase